MKRKSRTLSPAQIAARMRNAHKGRVAMIKGLIFWMLRDPMREQLTSEERLALGRCLITLNKVLKKWQPTL